MGTFTGMKHTLPGSSPRITSSLSRGHLRTNTPPGPFPPVTSPDHCQQDLPNPLRRLRGGLGRVVLRATCRDSPAPGSFPKTWGDPRD